MPYLKSSQITGLSPKPIDVTGFTQSASEDLEGTYSQHEVLLADAFNVTDNVTISDNLILAKLSDDGEAITVTGNASTTRTISGSGSLEGSTFAQTPNASLTSMTGVLGSAVTGSPTLTTPALGTPASGVVTNLSGVLPVGVTGGSGLDAVVGGLSGAVMYRKVGDVTASTGTFNPLTGWEVADDLSNARHGDQPPPTGAPDHRPAPGILSWPARG